MTVYYSRKFNHFFIQNKIGNALQIQLKCPHLSTCFFFHKITVARQNLSADLIYYLAPAINWFKQENTDLTEMNKWEQPKALDLFFNLIVFSFWGFELALSSQLDLELDTCCHCLCQSSGNVISIKFIRTMCPWTLALSAELPAA